MNEKRKKAVIIAAAVLLIVIIIIIAAALFKSKASPEAPEDISAGAPVTDEMPEI